MKTSFWDEIDAEETLERLERKSEKEKLKGANKIKAYELRIESIKYEAKREREELRMERVNKLRKNRRNKNIYEGNEAKNNINESWQ